MREAVAANAGQRIKGPITGGQNSLVRIKTATPAADPRTLKTIGRAVFSPAGPAKPRMTIIPKAAPIRNAGNTIRTLAARFTHEVYTRNRQEDPSGPVDSCNSIPAQSVKSFRDAAKVAELADALDLGSSGVTREGSSPSFRIYES